MQQCKTTVVFCALIFRFTAWLIWQILHMNITACIYGAIICVDTARIWKKSINSFISFWLMIFCLFSCEYFCFKIYAAPSRACYSSCIFGNIICDTSFFVKDFSLEERIIKGGYENHKPPCVSFSFFQPHWFPPSWDGVQKNTNNIIAPAKGIRPNR